MKKYSLCFYIEVEQEAVDLQDACNRVKMNLDRPVINRDGHDASKLWLPTTVSKSMFLRGEEMTKLIHRDDVPFEVAESMVEELQKLCPNATITFAGDRKLPPHQKAVLEKMVKDIKKQYRDSLLNKRCVDCGKSKDDREGWLVFHDENDKPSGFQCPECAKKEDQ